MFPERLRALRQGRGLSLPELADALNQSLTDYPRERSNTGPQIGSWERGVNAPSYIEMMKLADYFDVSLDFLTGREYTEIELDDLFVSTAKLNFDGHQLSSKDKMAIYGMIKGYLHGKQLETNHERVQSGEMTLPLGKI